MAVQGVPADLARQGVISDTAAGRMAGEAFNGYVMTLIEVAFLHSVPSTWK